MDDKDQRGRIHTTVIDPNKRNMDLLSKMVKSHPILHLTGEHACCEAVDLKEKGIGAHQIVLIYETEAVRAKALLKENPEINFILTGPNWPDSYEQAVRELKSMSSLVNEGFGNITRFGYDDGEINMPSNMLKFGEHIKSLRDRGRVKRNLNIGIIGMGEFGENIMRELQAEPWTGKISVYSDYFSQVELGNLDFLTVATKAQGGNKVQAMGSLDELVDDKPDVLLITTGPHNADYDMSREEFTRKQVVPTWEKIDKILASVTAKDYQGVIGILSHPPGAFLSRAHRKFAIPAHQLTSFSSDAVRAQAEYFQFVMSKMSLQGKAHEYRKENLPIDVFGEHGERACISWKDIFGEKHVLTPLPEDKERMNQRVREVGKEIMIAAKKSHFNYFDVPQAVKTSLSSMAYYRSAPEFAWYTRVGGAAVDAFARRSLSRERRADYENSFLMLPVDISHPDLGISLGGRFNPRELPAQLRKQLYQCLVSQSELVSQLA